MRASLNLENTGNTLRAVHFTDIHVQPERGAFEGLQRALEVVHSLEPKVDAILLGGDMVMNSVGAKLERVSLQWDLWDKAIAGYPDMPVFPCIGNQDCWGWNRKASGCSGKEPLYGKNMALHRLGLDRRFYSAKLGSWRLIVLDSLQQGGKHGFTARLDAEQLAWLENELQAEEQSPTVIVSHIPIVAGPADFFSSDVIAPAENGDWSFPGQHLHADSFELVELFRRYPNVKLCLAGHSHCAQRIEYRGIWFVHSPAVSGEWWRGPYQGFGPGFTILDLEPDGSFRSQFMNY